MSISSPKSNPLQVASAASHSSAPTAASQTDASAQVLFPKGGQSSAVGWRPETESLEADQPAATETLRQAFFDHSADKIAEAIAFKKMVSDPSSFATRGRSAAAAGPEMAHARVAPTASGADKASAPPPIESTIPNALEKLANNRRDKVAFGKDAILNLAKSLQKNVDLGIPKDILFHTVKADPKHGKIVFNAGHEDQIALAFSAKNGKLVIRLEGQAKKQGKAEEAMINTALGLNSITGDFSTKRGEQGRVLTFEATDNIASVDVTSKGVLLTRK